MLGMDIARFEDKSLRRLIESDYLLGVHDESRMGTPRSVVRKFRIKWI